MRIRYTPFAFIISVMFCTASAQATEGLWLGASVGPRFNSVGGDYADQAEAANAELSRLTTIGFGVFAMYEVHRTVRLEGSLFFDQRGVSEVTGSDAVPMTFNEKWNYIDLQLGGNWYPLGTDEDIQPYVGVYFQPGYYLGGSYTYTYGDGEGSTGEGVVSSEALAPWYLGASARIGVDAKIGVLLLGVNLGYEQGFSNLKPAGAETTKTSNSIVAGLRFALPLWTMPAP